MPGSDKGNQYMNTLRKGIVLLTILGIAGCGSTADITPEETPAPAASAETAPAPAAAAETAAEPTQEEIVDAVYQSGKESTVCIFIPGGNNGTGFVYKDKYVITNDHVLYDTEDFTMIDVQGQEYKGTIICSDSGNDIAVILADGMHAKSVTIADSAVSAGDTVICIGNPTDGEPFSFCTGTVLELNEEMQEMFDKNHRFILSDAGITSGYSGGPVFNQDGELIGISNAAFAGDLSAYDFEHLSLIIPIGRVREQIENTVSSGS